MTEQQDATAKTRVKKAPGNGARKVTELWEQRLTYTERGYHVSVGNFSLILENDPLWRGKLRFDARGNRVVVEPGCPISDSDSPREYCDSDDARLARWLEHSTYAIRCSPASPHLLGAVGTVAKQFSYDAVCDYLDVSEWDETARLDRLCPDYFGADDTAIHRAFGAKWMISAVARAYEPGAQVDHVLVLVGKQGGRKSTALAALCPQPEWFTDSLPALNDPKRVAECLHGFWIVEMAELDALSRSDLSAVKACITRRHDTYRAAYARRADRHGRRVAFAGSTNEDAFLRDSTGNRRFWPVTVGTIDVSAIIRDRDQLWAEAVHRYRAGEPWHLTDCDLIKAAEEAQDERFQIDPWEPAITEWLDKPTSSGLRNRVSVGEVLEEVLNLKIEHWDQRAENRVARVFQHLRWERRQKREDTKRRWAYERPGS